MVAIAGAIAPACGSGAPVPPPAPLEPRDEPPDLAGAPAPTGPLEGDESVPAALPTYTNIVTTSHLLDYDGPATLRAIDARRAVWQLESGAEFAIVSPAPIEFGLVVGAPARLRLRRSDGPLRGMYRLDAVLLAHDGALLYVDSQTGDLALAPGWSIEPGPAFFADDPVERSLRMTEGGRTAITRNLEYRRLDTPGGHWIVRGSSGARGAQFQILRVGP